MKNKPGWLLAGLVLALAACTPARSTPPTATITLPPISTTVPLTVMPSATGFSVETVTSEPVATSTPRTGLPDPAAYTWARVASGLDLPLDIQNAGDGSGRLFIVEKRGRIRILQNGDLLATPFLDIRERVRSVGTEQGLLGLAFHPIYKMNGEFFVNYIDKSGNTVIARFNVSGTDPNQADPASEVDLLHVDQPYSNHNGGGLAFGPDGLLYIGLGDGGSQGDPHRNAQNPQALLGKLLRIDVDAGDRYGIPAGNPFTGGTGLAEIWATGLRNPWRFSFDRLTGDLYIADVGQDAWEEVDVVPAGAAWGLNFGWSYYEGNHPYNDQPAPDLAFTFPVAEYSHNYGCSVTGGGCIAGRLFRNGRECIFMVIIVRGGSGGCSRTRQAPGRPRNCFKPG